MTRNAQMAPTPLTIFWFRRDLRIEDNKGLYHALKESGQVVGLFIFDSDILRTLPDRDDARVTFIHDNITALKERVPALWVRFGRPVDIFNELLRTHPIQAVYANMDFEPYATKRDQEIADLLGSRGIPFQTYLDHLIHHPREVLKADGTPYTVFTPYARAWRKRLEANRFPNEYASFRHYASEGMIGQWASVGSEHVPELRMMGFQRSTLPIPSSAVERCLIRNYAQTRDYPGKKGTSRLGVHFRFGTISIRQKARDSMALSEVYINELIWRDFYAQILAHFPHVADHPFKPAYERIEWLNREEDFLRWKEGLTGYPIVDAGMRELQATGFMHNRVRMITASFLTKHLLIDWKWGEAWFAQKLLDFDLASNNGGWQWAAGCGTDAAPYFRIFNPEAQQQRFDPDFSYIRQWVPEWNTPSYPKPVVDHAFARERCLATFKKALTV